MAMSLINPALLRAKIRLLLREFLPNADPRILDADLSFHDLGLDSIDALRLVVCLENELHVTLEDVSDLERATVPGYQGYRNASPLPC
ncbi:MAG: Phosphopantetheine attachment site [Pseudomonadota bacterium]|nr:Phosphopantetheine attachment site [Pseudomonadota bacterium]